MSARASNNNDNENLMYLLVEKSMKEVLTRLSTFTFSLLRDQKALKKINEEKKYLLKFFFFF